MLINLLTLDYLSFIDTIGVLLLAYIAWQVTPKKGGKHGRQKIHSQERR